MTRLTLIAAALCFGLVSVPAMAQPPQPEPRLLTVNGHGEVKARPDRATLSAGVVTEAKTAAAALSANSKAMNAVFATLKKLGIPDKAIQTSDFSVAPQYPSDSNRPRRITGYQVSNTVNVTVDDLHKLGPALDALVASGANSLGGIGFSIRDEQPLLAEARAAAVKDATAKAQTLARAAGVNLGAIVSIAEGGGVAVPLPRYRMAPMAAAAPVSPGENTVSADVSIAWEIR